MSEYNPPRIYRNANTNTVLAASSLRKAYAHQISREFRKQSKSLVLELDENVRLQGFLTSSLISTAQPLTIILHGWLGCANSPYLLPLATTLYQKGFNIFRLNLRDHGNTQHLNKDLFHSCRLSEVINAVTAIQQQVKHSDTYIIGFSLGGNFALRIGAKAENKNLAIDKIISVCPVMNADNALDEKKTMLKIYTEYYLRRWKNMLRTKHKYFPDDYDLTCINQQKSLNGMTEHLLLQYTEFESVQNYLQGYSITGNSLRTLSIESDVFISEDDPVIPAYDHENLFASEFLNIQLTKLGGHCGYLNGLFKTNWIDEQIIKQLTC